MSNPTKLTPVNVNNFRLLLDNKKYENLILQVNKIKSKNINNSNKK